MSLLSYPFFLLAGIAVVALAALRGLSRQAAFLVINLVFLFTLLGGVGSAGALGFILLGYACVTHVRRQHGQALPWLIVVLAVVFVYMRRYDFLEWLLPRAALTTALRTIGLSFVFFKVLHVVIDASSELLGRVDLLTYLNYSLNFTTYMMGPIQRYQDYRDQWVGTKRAIPATFEAHVDAANRILLGLVKAYILALPFQRWGLQPDTDLGTLSGPALIGQVYAFWVYLYLNFSGYTDVAIGVGSLMGIRPPENFDKPFLATNISDFWQRQHRSLTLWLTDYVFSPLYVFLLSKPWTARHKLLAANVALMTTMLVSGLWHGTTFSFLIFGLVHGLWFVIYRSWDTLLVRRFGRDGVRALRRHRLPRAVGIFLTFNATAFTFIFFQVRSDRLVQTFEAWLR